MNTKSAKELINKYQAGNATAEEVELIESWVMLGRVTELDLSEAELAEDFKAIRSTLPLKYETKRIKLWPSVAGVALIWKVAAAVAAMTLGIWLYYTPSYLDSQLSRTEATKDLYTNDVAPGKNTATLTLANGKTIMLDTSKTNVVVTDSVKAMTMLTARTPRGGTYQVTLPDGTKVWLNADSKISFPSQFNGKERKILLEGEAYFAVVHNEKQPFLVESKGQVVEDIGTEFNINAYPNEGSIKTTLVEGSAKVNAVLLSPNEQASLAGDKIQVTKVDPETAIAWKNNKFMFDSQGIEDIMKMVARWYNVTVVYEGDIPDDKFGGSVSRFDNVSKVLRALEKTKNVRFRVEGRTIYVSK